MDLFALHESFDRKLVSWRAQSVTKQGDKALALAYIDARDVMNRLDEVCGPAGWQDRYVETPLGRVICTIEILIDGQWVSKSDGAGKTDVEGDKGGISDAFKRAAVKWGVGRYLYDIESPWVPCESYESNGRRHWKRWTVDPWSCVRSARNPAVSKSEPVNETLIQLRRTMKEQATKPALTDWLRRNKPMIDTLTAADRDGLEREYASYRDGLQLVAVASAA